MKIPQLKRCYLIVHILNDLRPHHVKDIQFLINKKMDANYCKSQIDKDISWLKWNMDMDDFQSSGKGIQLLEKLDFFERLKNYLQ